MEHRRTVCFFAMEWNLLSNVVPSSLAEIQEILLANRAITNKETFLHPIPPLELTYEQVGLSTDQLDKLIARLEDAKKNKETIAIYGDYDCDGVCATAILWETLHALGFKVVPFIPHRERHGYGLSKKGLDELFETCTPAILISVDNGIVAHRQWEHLRVKGVYTVLTDHHQPDDHVPSVDVLLHSTGLCGATVAWMVAVQLEKHFGQSTDFTQQLIDLCAIATIADQVPLLEANRSFAKYGLEQLNKTTRVGLLKLIESAGLSLGKLDVYSVNFVIAPRINAMGRLEHALDALRALCTKKPDRVIELIGRLSQVNQTRQDLTQQLIDKALLRASEWKDEHIIIVEDADFHEGVIGLIAGRLCEKYHKPSICISVGELTSKASCRSIPGVNITDLLRQIADDLLEVGGHPMAAGFKVESSKIETVKLRLRQITKEQIDATAFRPTIDIDCVLPPGLLTLDTVSHLELLAPFGSGNREPVFVVNDLQILSSSAIGKEGKHLKVSVLPKGGQPNEVLSAIGFGMGSRIEDFIPQSWVSIAGHLHKNVWNQKTTLQFMIRNANF
ncbi:single-stranded-DNA-specific exonuclease RecJ [Candidatus Woesebacteria bacterium]|nr:single-stranded-DNA-specific exonuclease RecJ [Candidatus Woesebacteria bacterium]